jgi:hypothetical protein
MKDVKWNSSERDTDILTIGAIRPLLNFSELCSIELGLRAGIDLEDADMKEMAKAWPQLCSFSMRTRHTAERRPRVTLTGLIPLVKYCQNLSSLMISVNAWEVEVSKSRPAKGVEGTALEVLGIGDSPIADPVPVAVFLSDLFPEVRDIYTFDGDDGWPVAQDPKWCQVEELMSTFASIRSQERNYDESGHETSSAESDASDNDSESSSITATS